MRPSLHILEKHWPLVPLGHANDHTTVTCQHKMVINGNAATQVPCSCACLCSHLCFFFMFCWQHLADGTAKLMTNRNQVALSFVLNKYKQLKLYHTARVYKYQTNGLHTWYSKVKPMTFTRHTPVPLTLIQLSRLTKIMPLPAGLRKHQ